MVSLMFVFVTSVLRVSVINEIRQKTKGSPNFRLWVTTVDHGSFRFFFNSFESSSANNCRQKRACVILFQMKAPIMQHSSSCKCLHWRHRLFQTSFINLYADFQ